VNPCNELTAIGQLRCPAVTRQAAVACGNPATAEAAVQILAAGGNAVDAVLAAGFTAAVAEPGLTSLGGGGFLLYRQPSGANHLLDFFVDAPGRGLPEATLSPHFTPITITFSGAEQVFHAGYGSVGVPGVLDGYLEAHRRFGALPLADVVEPARVFADAGVELAVTQAEVLGLLRNILTLTDEARVVFAPTGAVPGAGEPLHNALLSQFLVELTEGSVTGWRDIPSRHQLVAEMSEHDGLLTLADLTSYRVIDREPMVASYRDATVTSNPAPSFGGSIVVDALTRLAEADQAPPKGLAHTVAAVESLAEATDRAKQNRAPQSSQGTTHISVADGDGGLASMTTSNGSCSGVMVPGTGVQLNNVMGEADLHPDGFHATTPGTRVGSMMAPMFVDLPDGRVIAMGSGGSERIRSALLQTIVNLVDHGASLAEAIATPRIHHDGRRIHVEPGVREQLSAALAALAPVNRWSRSDLYFGGVHGVMRRPDGSVEAVGDRRRDGVGRVIEL